MAARSLSAEARAESQGISEDEFGRYLANVAKPGNPIHVRVIDPDRSRTAGDRRTDRQRRQLPAAIRFRASR